MLNNRKYFLDKETIAQEEREAEERGISVFQLRHIKKMDERRKKKQQKYFDKVRDEKERREEKERIRKEKEKEKLLENKESKPQEEPTVEEKSEEQIKKRPVGRPRKRGRKRKYRKKKIVEKERKTVSWNYKIVSCLNGRQNGFIGLYTTANKAYEKINELKKESENVTFPVQVSHNDKVVDTRYEYLILERKNNEKLYFLRNEYGKLVEQRTDSEDWRVFDKFSYVKEETFWVWGYNNKKDRKTFDWIYDNILIGKIVTEYDLRFVLLYKNKIVFKDDYDNLDIIFCKTVYDAVRFYNLLKERVNKEKKRQIFFMGAFNKITDRRRELEERLMETTGWSKKKIQMSSTTEHIK